MAKFKVSGKTQDEIDERRESYTGDEPFEERYCLAKIPHQPDDYDGPDRFCLNTETYQLGSNQLCKYHGGKGSINVDNLDPLAAMTHGMRASRSNLIKDFDEKDQALYHWITSQYPEQYDIDLAEDPNAAYDVHRLAAEIVRAERGRGYTIAEGEVQEEPIRNDEGQIVLDENGQIVTEKSQHYLSDMMHKQDNKISKLQKQLGITRKEQLRQDSTDEAVEVIKGFSELGEAFLKRGDSDYDPDDAPWEQDND
jgi:hypothetical protein